MHPAALPAARAARALTREALLARLGLRALEAETPEALLAPLAAALPDCMAGPAVLFAPGRAGWETLAASGWNPSPEIAPLLEAAISESGPVLLSAAVRDRLPMAGGYASCVVALALGRGHIGLLLSADGAEDCLLFLERLAALFAAALRRAEREDWQRQLAAFAVLLPEPVLDCGAEGHTGYRNAAVEGWLERLKLADPALMLPLRHAQLAREALAAAQPIRDAEARIGPHTLLWTYVPAPALGRVFLLGRDVGESRRTEALLRLSEARYRLLTEQSTDIISRHAPQDWTFLYASPAVEALLGYTPEEIVGKSSVELFHPDDARAYAERAPTVIYDRGIYLATYRYRHKDGHYVWLESTSRTLRDPASGELLEIISVSRDVSRRLHAEEQALRAQAEMAHIGRLVLLGEMASGLAHELNQPLAAIVNYARGAIRRIDAEPPVGLALLRGALERVTEQAARASEIIRRLRGFARKGEFQRTPIDLAELVAGIVHFCLPEARRHGVTLEADPCAGLPRVLGDKVQIEQVLLNLIRNAIEADAAAHAEAAETSPREPVRVRIGCEQVPAGLVAVHVCDRGPGLPEGDPERPFEAFYTTKPKGLGLGLSISRSIMEAHGGHLWAEPRPGGGAVFSFTLPTVD